jgi:NAD(P)-dependent dehydrogenase (short-subunit alcohol dehydrogenase family)
MPSVGDTPLLNDRGEPPRVLVVGASSGIGAATARALVLAGARVAGAARRTERVAELTGVRAVRCDVTVEDECELAVATAAEHLGGIDALVYATGLTGLTPLNASTQLEWARIFSTNVIGAASITRAALPHLRAGTSDGRALFLSSDSAVKPYPGLVAYGASKAALGAFCLGLASEFADLRVTEVMVGPTIDTEVGTHFEGQDLASWLNRWQEEGFVRYGYQLSDDVAAVIVAALRNQRPDPLVMAVAELSVEEIGGVEHPIK